MLMIMLMLMLMLFCRVEVGQSFMQVPPSPRPTPSWPLPSSPLPLPSPQSLHKSCLTGRKLTCESSFAYSSHLDTYVSLVLQALLPGWILARPQVSLLLPLKLDHKVRCRLPLLKASITTTPAAISLAIHPPTSDLIGKLAMPQTNSQ